MALGWNGRFSSIRRMSRDQMNGTGKRPSSNRVSVSRRMSMRRPICDGSIASGHSPISPMITALSLPWPMPVADSEPKSCTSTRRTCSSSPRSRKPCTNNAAARIGPTVWELEGPMPILNRSKTLIAIAAGLLDVPTPGAKAPGDGAATLKLQSVGMAASSGFYPVVRRLTPTHSCPRTPRVFHVVFSPFFCGSDGQKRLKKAVNDVTDTGCDHPCTGYDAPCRRQIFTGT